MLSQNIDTIQLRTVIQISLTIKISHDYKLTYFVIVIVIVTL
jgi:hypothetical protein